jgi:hypothetical protein
LLFDKVGCDGIGFGCSSIEIIAVKQVNALLAPLSAPLRPFRVLQLLVAGLTLFGSSSAVASVTFDASSSQTGAAVSSITWSHVLGAGGNRLVVCEVSVSNPSTAVAYTNPVVSFGGVTLTPISGSLAPASGTSKIQSQLFYGTDTTLSALVGTQTVTVTESSAPAGGTAAGCTSFFGVAQSGPYGAALQYSGSGAPTATSISVANAGDLVVDGLAGGYTVSGTGKTATANTANGQTQSFNLQLSTSGVLAASSYEFAPASGSNMLGWTDTLGRFGYSMAVFAASTATYAVNTTIAPVGGGTVALSPAGPYGNGASVTVTASPAVGYAFGSFSGDLTSTSNPAMLTVNGNKNITANFTSVQCTLTTTTSGSGTGSVTLSPAPTNGFYSCGTQVTVTAVAGSGSSFGTFSGALTGGTNPQMLTLNTNATVNASFVTGTNCTLTTSVTPSSTAGSIAVSPAGTSFSCGTQITVTATPAQYYSLTGFSGAVSGTTNPQTFTLNANSTVTAAFAQTSFPINTTIVGPGTVVANPADTGSGYLAGTMVQLTATPNSGSTFSGFSGDLTGTANPQTITVNAVQNVTATFASALITKDAVSHASGSGSSGMITWNHTIGSGASRALVIAVGEADSSAASPDQAAVVASVTYNGVYATPIPGSVVYGGTSGMVQSQLFYLLESELPAAGTYPVVVTLQGPVGGLAAGGVSLFGVNQGAPEAVVTNKNTAGANQYGSYCHSRSCDDRLDGQRESVDAVASGVCAGYGDCACNVCADDERGGRCRRHGGFEPESVSVSERGRCAADCDGGHRVCVLGMDRGLHVDEQPTADCDVERSQCGSELHERANVYAGDQCRRVRHSDACGRYVQLRDGDPLCGGGWFGVYVHELQR